MNRLFRAAEALLSLVKARTQLNKDLRKIRNLHKATPLLRNSFPIISSSIHKLLCVHNSKTHRWIN